MKRASVLMITAALMFMLFSAGCEDETENAGETGIRIYTQDCLDFGIYVFIDDEEMGFISALEPANIILPAGTYQLFARTNAAWEGHELCWTGEYTVTDGELTDIVLPCSTSQYCE